jgi:hypothetical protein
MYNKSRVYPKSEPVQYSAGFGKDRLPRKTWLQEEQAAPATRYRDPYGMPIVQDDPGQDQRYKDYSKRRGGKDPLGFAAEEAKRRFQPAVQPTPFPVPDEALPEPKKWVDTSSRSGGVEAWKKAGMPGFDPMGTYSQVTGTAKDGTEFGLRAQADAYDRWQAGDQGPEQGSPRGKMPMVRNPQELYAEEWANRNQPFNASSMAPGDASGKMPSYPGSTLKSPDGKVFNGDMMIDDGNYKPSGPIDKPKREKWIDTPQTQSDPTDQYRQQPVRETSDFNNPAIKKPYKKPYAVEDYGPNGPTWQQHRAEMEQTGIANYYPLKGDPRENNGLPVLIKRPSAAKPGQYDAEGRWEDDMTPEMKKQSEAGFAEWNKGAAQRVMNDPAGRAAVQESTNASMMGPEGSADRYVFHEQALQNASSPEAYQAHYQAMEKIGQPPGKEYMEARKNYRPMTDGMYGESYQTDPSTARYGVPARTSFTANYQPFDRRS